MLRLVLRHFAPFCGIVRLFAGVLEIFSPGFCRLSSDKGGAMKSKVKGEEKNQSARAQTGAPVGGCAPPGTGDGRDVPPCAG
jgi:hypothetical protein